MVVFVVDVARGESKTSCLLHSVDVLRPNFVVVGIGFELRLRNAADADHHYRVIEGFGCKHAFHTIIAPLKQRSSTQLAKRTTSSRSLDKGTRSRLRRWCTNSAG